MTAGTATADRATRSTPPTARPAPSLARQALRLTRVEFVQMWRYRTALFYVIGMPLFFMVIMSMVPGPESVTDVDPATFTTVNVIALLPVLLGLLHVSNVYAVRREKLVLKRLRVSGVPPAAIFGATAVSVVVVTLVQAVLIGGFLAGGSGVVPADPVLLVVALTAGAVMMTCFGAAFTRLTRNAESTQMLSVLPLLAAMILGGVTAPLDVFPEPVTRVLWLTPTAPVVDLVRGAYLGQDFFFGSSVGGAQLGMVELWVAAGPALLVTAAWVAVSVVLLRVVRWDPRQAG